MIAACICKHPHHDGPCAFCHCGWPKVPPPVPYGQGEPAKLKGLQNLLNAAMSDTIRSYRTAVDDIMDKLRHEVHFLRAVETNCKKSPNGWKAMQV